MGLGFFLWAFCCFDGQKFGLCGKTVEGVRRNVLSEVLPLLEGMGAKWKEVRSRNLLTVWLRGRKNVFYLFGGQDERSAAFIQGMTLAGVLLDEAARCLEERAMELMGPYLQDGFSFVGG